MRKACLILEEVLLVEHFSNSHDYAEQDRSSLRYAAAVIAFATTYLGRQLDYPVKQQPKVSSVD
jgi:hypothetical protein